MIPHGPSQGATVCCHHRISSVKLRELFLSPRGTRRNTSQVTKRHRTRPGSSASCVTRVQLAGGSGWNVRTVGLEGTSGHAPVWEAAAPASVASMRWRRAAWVPNAMLTFAIAVFGSSEEPCGTRFFLGCVHELCSEILWQLFAKLQHMRGACCACSNLGHVVFFLDCLITYHKQGNQTEWEAESSTAELKGHREFSHLE